MITRARLQERSQAARRFVDVPIPEMNDTIRVQAMSARERAEFEQYFQDKKGVLVPERQREVRERLAVTCCVDEAGNRILTPEDVEFLAQLDATILDRIACAARDLAGLGQSDYGAVSKN